MEFNNIKKQVIILLLFFSIIITFTTCLFISFHQTSIKIINVDENLKSEADIITYTIDYAGPDSLNKTGIGANNSGAGRKYYIIQGFAGIDTESTKTFNTQILLKKNNSSSSMYYCLSTEMTPRSDLESYGENAVSFMYGGFTARFKKSNIPQGTYDIYIYYKNNKHNILVKTDSVLEVNDVN